MASAPSFDDIEIQADRHVNTLREPVSTTILRDVKLVGSLVFSFLLSFVLVPKQALRNHL